MGWFYHSAPPAKHHDRNAEIDRIFTSANPERDTLEVLQKSWRGNTCYVACRINGVTHGFVILTKSYMENGTRWWGYKDMDETMLPYYFDAPASLIRLLSPTTNENALEWRRRCLATTPTKFRLPEPLSFGSFKAQEFEKAPTPGRRNTYRTLDTATPILVRLQKRHLEGATPL